jgi:hypothetical protein
MVLSRKGTGNPSPPEVERMLARARGTLEGDRAWLNAELMRLFSAEAKLNQAFTAYLD